MSLTRSASSTLIPTYTNAGVTIYCVTACASMLTRVAGTFVGIWNRNINTETSLLDAWHIAVCG